MITMNRIKVKNIIDKVYHKIRSDYNSNAIVEVHRNIYERLSGIKGMSGSACAQAEYDWNENKIYIYTSRMFSEEDIIRSLIHECVHSGQSRAKFNAYYLCGETYDTHPYEIEARNEENNWKKYKLNTINYG